MKCFIHQVHKLMFKILYCSIGKSFKKFNSVYSNLTKFKPIYSFIVEESQSCRSLSQSISRVWSSLIPVRGSSDVATDKFGFDVSRINSPGQRFTATHGISANKGERKVFV